MTDCERVAMGVWKWGAFLDRAEFLENKKLWLKLEFSISIPSLGQMQKLWHFSKLLINILKFQIPTATKITSSYPF